MNVPLPVIAIALLAAVVVASLIWVGRDAQRRRQKLATDSSPVFRDVAARISRMALCQTATAYQIRKQPNVNRRLGQNKPMRFLPLAIITLLLIAGGSCFVSPEPVRQSPKSVATARRTVDPRQPSFVTVIPKDDGSADASALRHPDALPKAPSAVARPIATIEEEDLLSSEVVPLDAMKNRGSATSLSAAESYLYAAGRGDHDSLTALFGFSASMSSATRIAYDALMPRLSANAAKEAEGVSGVQLLERQVFGPNDELVRIRMIRMDGSKVDESFLMQRTDSGWRRDMDVKAYLLAKSQRGQ